LHQESYLYKLDIPRQDNLTLYISDHTVHFIST
jgi:hypothetical protein